MGHIKDIKSNLDPQAFPGATFEIAGEVPASQCSEAQVEGEPPGPTVFMAGLTHIGNFIGWNLTGKKVTVTDPPAKAGTFNITDNTDDALITDAAWGIPPTDVTYYVHNGGELILTRDVQSFAEFIHAAGHSYTIKGGKLFTTIPSNQLKNACTILFDPLT